MKHLLMMTMILSAFLQSFAAEPEVCNRIRQKYSNTAFIQTEFDQSIYWAVREKTTKNHGSILLAPGNKFRVELANETWVSDGSVYWQYNRNGNQVVIDTCAKLDRSLLPSHFLTSFLSNHRFTEKIRGGGRVTLVWNADSTGDQEYRSITLSVQESSGTIASLVVTDKNMNIHTYLFRKTTFGKPLPATNFHFEAPPNAHIIDNRN
jgi:outer membrane lipoprotein-sorting protein